MKYKKLGNSGIDISVIGHGTWQMGNDFFGNTDESEAIKSIHASLDNGVNLVDTAPGYGLDGDSEKLVGKAIEGRRDKVVLSTKLGILRIFGAYVKCLDPAVMRKELELSLGRLKTDYIDLYFIHWPEYNNSLVVALQTMLEFKKEGKIRAIGVSNFSIDEIDLAVDVADIAAVQPPLSMLNRSSIDNGILALCNDKNLATLTYGSLGGGILAGVGLEQTLKVEGNEIRGAFYGYYAEPMLSKCRDLVTYLRKIADNRGVPVSEVSINWALAQKGVTTALVGARTALKASENAKAADWELTCDELSGIESEYKSIFG